MSLTQTDLDALETALINGERTVTFSDGRSVTFASAEDLSRRIEYVRKRITANSGRQKLLSEFSKGVQS